mgnify:CR=1 FL=1
MRIFFSITLIFMFFISLSIAPVSLLAEEGIRDLDKRRAELLQREEGLRKEEARIAGLKKDVEDLLMKRKMRAK